MNEQQRNQIVGMKSQGLSIRQIAKKLSIARNTVRSVVREVDTQRSEPTLHPELTSPARRSSCLDPYMQTILDLLNKYPDITAMRVFEELQADGFTGGYTIVKDRVRQIRPRPSREPVERF